MILSSFFFLHEVVSIIVIDRIEMTFIVKTYSISQYLFIILVMVSIFCYFDIYIVLFIYFYIL